MRLLEIVRRVKGTNRHFRPNNFIKIAEAKVDDRHYEYLRSLTTRWYLTRKGYPLRYEGKTRKMIYLARDVATLEGIPLTEELDHKNGDKLDAQANNLRPASRTANRANSKRQSNNRSGFKGVSWKRGIGKYRARIAVRGRQILLGNYGTATEAARVYDVAAIRLFGEFARTNEMLGLL